MNHQKLNILTPLFILLFMLLSLGAMATEDDSDEGGDEEEDKTFTCFPDEGGILCVCVQGEGTCGDMVKNVCDLKMICEKKGGQIYCRCVADEDRLREEGTVIGRPNLKMNMQQFGTKNKLPPPSVMEAPSNVKIANRTANSVTINWIDNSTNESGFIIERQVMVQKVINPKQWKRVYTINDKRIASRQATGRKISKKDSGLKPNTHYCYRVAAINASATLTSKYSKAICPMTTRKKAAVKNSPYGGSAYQMPYKK